MELVVDQDLRRLEFFCESFQRRKMMKVWWVDEEVWTDDDENEEEEDDESSRCVQKTSGCVCEHRQSNNKILVDVEKEGRGTMYEV